MCAERGAYWSFSSWCQICGLVTASMLEFGDLAKTIRSMVKITKRLLTTGSTTHYRQYASQTRH